MRQLVREIVARDRSSEAEHVEGLALLLEQLEEPLLLLQQRIKPAPIERLQRRRGDIEPAPVLVVGEATKFPRVPVHELFERKDPAGESAGLVVLLKPEKRRRQLVLRPEPHQEDAVGDLRLGQPGHEASAYDGPYRHVAATVASS